MPAQETTYEHDANGLLVRSTTWTESEWDDPQQAAWFIALDEYEKSRCGGCGGDVNETFDPANEFGYVVEPPSRCHRCTALDKAAEEFHHSGGKHMRALRFPSRLARRG